MCRARGQVEQQRRVGRGDRVERRRVRHVRRHDTHAHHGGVRAGAVAVHRGDAEVVGRAVRETRHGDARVRRHAVAHDCVGAVRRGRPRHDVVGDVRRAGRGRGGPGQVDRPGARGARESGRGAGGAGVVGDRDGAVAVVVGEVLVALRQGQDAAGAVGAGEAAEAEVLGRGRAAVLDVTVVSTLDAATTGTAGAAVTAEAGAAHDRGGETGSSVRARRIGTRGVLALGLSTDDREELAAAAATTGACRDDVDVVGTVTAVDPHDRRSTTAAARSRTAEWPGGPADRAVVAVERVETAGTAGNTAAGDTRGAAAADTQGQDLTGGDVDRTGDHAAVAAGRRSALAVVSTTAALAADHRQRQRADTLGHGEGLRRRLVVEGLRQRRGLRAVDERHQRGREHGQGDERTLERSDGAWEPAE